MVAHPPPSIALPGLTHGGISSSLSSRHDSVVAFHPEIEKHLPPLSGTERGLPRHSSVTRLPRIHRLLSLERSANDLELRSSTSLASPNGLAETGRRGSRPMASPVRGLARHTLGLLLLLLVVFMWTTSNFLGSTIFADKTYAKPFFLTYLNTCVFTTALIPIAIRKFYRNWFRGTLRSSARKFVTNTLPWLNSSSKQDGSGVEAESEAFLIRENATRGDETRGLEDPKHLDTWTTAKLSLQFCILWFLANYFSVSCLQYTTVASATILTSTSSIWTLLIGVVTQTEKFTWRKLVGVLASLAGVFLISQADLSEPPSSSSSSSPKSLSNQVKSRSGLGETFPDKSPAELAFGDAMAGLSALIYGLYAISLKRTSNAAASKDRTLDMPLFFGMVGLINTVLLVPFFPILSALNVEPFQLPPTSRVWTILLVNSFVCLASDVCWAYAMVLTSPLVVTVGLSLTIPLSLVGEIVVQGRSESLVYWLGAVIVVCSFVFVDREEVQQESTEGLRDSDPKDEVEVEVEDRADEDVEQAMGAPHPHLAGGIHAGYTAVDQEPPHHNRHRTPSDNPFLPTR